MKTQKQYWVKNTTDYDLNLKDLDLRIPAQKSINLFKYKPTLTMDKIKISEKEGLLADCFGKGKLVKLPFAPVSQLNTSINIKESKTPIPSRAKTSIVMNINEKDFIEEIEEDNRRLNENLAIKYASYVDGVVDPMVVSSEDKSFNAVVRNIPTSDTEKPPTEAEPVKRVNTKIKTVGQRKKPSYYTVDTDEEGVADE